MDGAAATLAEPDALGDEDGLPEGASVPGGAGAGGEVDAGGPEAGRRRGRGDGVYIDRASEPLARPRCGLGVAASGDLYGWPPIGHESRLLVGFEINVLCLFPIVGAQGRG